METTNKYVVGGQNTQVQNTATVTNPVTTTQQETQTQTQQQIEDGDKKSQDILKWAGIIAAGALLVGGTIYGIKKGKTTSLEDIDFNKGIAKLKQSGEEFSGTIKHKLKNGDKVKMTYENGILKKSTRKGSKAFTKTYEYGTDGKISKLVKDGKELNTAEKRKLTKRILDEAHEREIQKEALERTREARNTETKAQEFQERIFKNVDKSTQKSAEESANVLNELLDEKYKQEALERADAKVAAKEFEEKAQKEYFSRVDKTGGKVARESARKFMTPYERVDDILNDESLNYNAFELKNAQKNSEYIKKYFNPETISALSDRQIATLNMRANCEADFAEAAKFLEDNFTTEEIKKISNGTYSNVFIQNLFDATVYNPNEAQNIIKWYKGK